MAWLPTINMIKQSSRSSNFIKRRYDSQVSSVLPGRGTRNGATFAQLGRVDSGRARQAQVDTPTTYPRLLPRTGE